VIRKTKGLDQTSLSTSLVFKSHDSRTLGNAIVIVLIASLLDEYFYAGRHTDAAAHAAIAAEGGGDLARHRALALVIDRDRRLDNPQRCIIVLTGLDQRERVLWETGSTEARAGMQELLADAIVEANAAGDFLHIGADLLGKIGDLVDESDLGREKGIRRIFGQLRRAAIGVKVGCALRCSGR
jgi:hypothetical protein